MRTIKGRLLAIFLMATAPLFLCFGLGVFANYKSDLRAAEEKSLRAALALTREYAAEVDGLHALLETLATHPAMRNPQPGECLAILQRVHASTPYVDNLGLADAEGRVIASSVQGHYRVEDRKYFLDALRTRAFSVGEYVVGRATGHPTLHFSLPVLDPQGRVTHVLFASYNLNRFETIISHQNLPPGAVLNLTDHNGRVIYRHPRDPVVKPGLQDQPHLRAQVDGTREEGVFRAVGLDKVERLFGFRRLRLHPGDAPYLYARVTIPVPIAFADANRFAGWALGSFLLTAALAFGLLHLLAERHLVGPIRRLSRVAREAGSGDFAIRSQLETRQDEIGQVGRAFDKMVASLEARQEERDRAEAALRESEGKLRTLIDRISDALLVLDLDGHAILDVNQTMCAMYGYTREEALGATISDLSLGEPPYTSADAAAHFAQMAGGEPQVFEWRARRRDQSLFWAEVSMRRATLGGAERCLVLVRDITERKDSEAERGRLTEQLHQAQKMESIGRLAGGIAHDFNNLLTPIMIYSELLAEDPAAGSRDGRKAHQILSAAAKAKALISKLMGLSRKQILNLEIVDIHRVIESFIDIIRRTIRENIDITVECADQPLLVRADATQIEQVLMNLVINAGDAIQGGGRIRIRAWRDPREPRVRIAVEDTGCGMDAETLRRVFEPFFTTKPKGEGTGLGLATVLGIVQQHGGEVTVDSTPGEGSRFVVTLPAHQGPAATEPAHAASALPQAAARGQIALLAEDNDLVRAIAAELLHRLGFEVLEAPAPAEALVLATGHRVDLLISDVIMPGMNGPQLYHRLRETQPWLRAIFMSGHTDSILVEHGQLPPGTDFLQKPFSREAFGERVSRMMAAPIEA